MKNSIAIIGSGDVGSTIAYTLLLKNLARSITLIDIDEKRCRGQLLDLSDSILQSKVTQLKMGTYTDAHAADIVIICAGVRQRPGQTRASLLETNKKIIAHILKQITPLKKDTCIIMVTNPVDVLTHLAVSLSQLPANRVLGSGTILEGARLRNLIAQKLSICPTSIHAYILGEHGPSQFPAWSICSIGGIPLEKFPGVTPDELDQCAKQAEQRVYEIIECKGATYYGVSAAVVSMCETIVYDRKQLLPLSCFVPTLGTCLTVPAILGGNGIEKTLEDTLNPREKKSLEECAYEIKKLI